jgi:hypothetical protein
VAAWFLPVATDLPGWMAFRHAFAPVWPYGHESSAVEDAIPHVLSASTNVVFVVMWAQLVTRRLTRPGLWLRVAIACCVVDLYWFVLMLRDGGGQRLGIGYYVWLAAFAQLAIIGGLLMRGRSAARASAA